MATFLSSKVISGLNGNANTYTHFGTSHAVTQIAVPTYDKLGFMKNI